MNRDYPDGSIVSGGLLLRLPVFEVREVGLAFVKGAPSVRSNHQSGIASGKVFNDAPPSSLLRYVARRRNVILLGQ
jgi:hypothetical protein